MFDLIGSLTNDEIFMIGLLVNEWSCLLPFEVFVFEVYSYGKVVKIGFVVLNYVLKALRIILKRGEMFVN